MDAIKTTRDYELVMKRQTWFHSASWSDVGWYSAVVAVCWCVNGYGGIFHNDRLIRGHSDSLQATLVKTVKGHVWLAKINMG